MTKTARRISRTLRQVQARRISSFVVCRRLLEHAQPPVHFQQLVQNQGVNVNGIHANEIVRRRDLIDNGLQLVFGFHHAVAFRGRIKGDPQ